MSHLGLYDLIPWLPSLIREEVSIEFEGLCSCQSDGELLASRALVALLWFALAIDSADEVVMDSPPLLPLPLLFSELHACCTYSPFVSSTSSIEVSTALVALAKLVSSPIYLAT